MMRIGIVLVILALAGALWWWKSSPRKLSPAEVAQAYTPLPAPDGPLRVFHLGHSLVGRDMPAMLAQLADEGHSYDSQLGWGTSLREHWEPDLPINGFEAENAHPRFRPARDAVGSGAYDAVVLTEMVEIKDAVKYHKSGTYFPLWANLARQANPQARVYLYETWHHLDDPQGWLNRLDTDLSQQWEDQILLRDLSRASDRSAQPTPGQPTPARLIPAGQVMARFARALADRGGVEGLASPEDLFARNADGSRDTIHLNDKGAYLVALTHYAVLYHQTPVGLPHQLLRADGSVADAPSPDAARLMQQVVWDVVTSLPKTGVAR